MDGQVPHQRGAYRVRRVGLFWVVERIWGDRWVRVGGLMRYLTAHAVFHELDDWQQQASLEARSIMSGKMPGRGQPQGAE